jgi:hypothetical protein
VITSLALLLVGGAAASYFLRRYRSARAGQPPRPAPRRAEDVRIGDALLYMGSDFVVTGELVFDEEGPVLRVFALTDGSKERFLLVEPGQPGIRSLLDEAPGLEMHGNPPESIPHHGTSYRMRKRGIAKASSQGEVPRLAPGKYEYYRYAAAGRQVLLALRREADTLMFAGEELMPGTLEILPGGS